ncbi:Predicted phage phi-C31 gp36 major capsid-like protein [Providencia alcalifaciens]|nr:Predicted phage phi-C31 gp36 major capsid-like protein [Providencia alcalifaciens]
MDLKKLLSRGHLMTYLMMMCADYSTMILTIFSEEQRTEWNKAKTELENLEAQIEREEQLRSLDQSFVDENEQEQRNNPPDGSDKSQVERRNAAFDRFLRCGASELTAEERQALRELNQEARAQGVAPDEKGGFTVPTQMLNKVVEQMKAYGGIASIAQVLNTSNGQDIIWSTSDGTLEEGELLGENTQTTEEDVDFGSATLGAKKLSSKMIRVSNELLQEAALICNLILQVALLNVLGVVKQNILLKERLPLCSLLLFIKGKYEYDSINHSC